jgi:hypothetical protein
LFGKTGIVCPHCGAKLRVLQARVALSVILMWGSWVLGAAVFQRLRRGDYGIFDQRIWIVLVLTYAAGTLALQAFCAPRLAQLRLADEGERLYFPLGWERASEVPPAASNNRWRGS